MSVGQWLRAAGLAALTDDFARWGYNDLEACKRIDELTLAKFSLSDHQKDLIFDAVLRLRTIENTSGAAPMRPQKNSKPKLDLHHDFTQSATDESPEKQSAKSPIQRVTNTPSNLTPPAKGSPSNNAGLTVNSVKPSDHEESSDSEGNLPLDVADNGLYDNVERKPRVKRSQLVSPTKEVQEQEQQHDSEDSSIEEDSTPKKKDKNAKSDKNLKPVSSSSPSAKKKGFFGNLKNKLGLGKRMSAPALTVTQPTTVLQAGTTVPPTGAGFRASDITMSDEERIQIMTMVKQGGMSQDEAMEIVLRTLRERRAKAKELPKYNLASLSEDQRIAILSMVRDGKLTVDEAYLSIINNTNTPFPLPTASSAPSIIQHPISPAAQRKQDSSSSLSPVPTRRPHATLSPDRTLSQTVSSESLQVLPEKPPVRRALSSVEISDQFLMDLSTSALPLATNTSRSRPKPPTRALPSRDKLRQSRISSMELNEDVAWFHLAGVSPNSLPALGEDVDGDDAQEIAKIEEPPRKAPIAAPRPAPRQLGALVPPGSMVNLRNSLKPVAKPTKIEFNREPSLNEEA